MSFVNKLEKKHGSLRSVMLGDTWDKAKELAKLEDRTVSSFLRGLILKTYERKKKQSNKNFFG